jgi:hypothetical protein
MCQSFGIGTTNGSLTVFSCHVDITGVPVICWGVNQTLTATPGFSQYIWDFGPTTPSIVTFNATVPWTYNVTATDASGCTAEASFTVTPTVRLLDFNVSGDGAICPGSVANVYLSGSEVGVTYQVYKVHLQARRKRVLPAAP